VIIVNESLASVFWPAREDPILVNVWSLARKDPANDRREWVLDAKEISAWITMSRIEFTFRRTVYQSEVCSWWFRTASDPALLTATIIRAAQALDPEVPAFDVRTMEGRLLTH